MSYANQLYKIHYCTFAASFTPALWQTKNATMNICPSSIDKRINTNFLFADDAKDN